jgi:uracil-DNA glycosylase family 4
MNHARRQEYLAAIGLETWITRGKSTATATATATAAPAFAAADATGAATVAPPARAALASADVVARREAAVPRAVPAAREAGADWAELRARVAACTRCALCNTRTQTVFGVGSQTAEWLIVGEAPGADEDRQGEPFVGRAGQLLNSMLHAIGLAREQVYIANILKCRPPGNRDPAANEAAECLPYLEQQIALLKPKILLAVGRIAAQNLLRTEVTLGRLRQQVHRFGISQVPLVVTYHPAYLLRTPTDKRKTWEDLKFAREVSARV